MNRELRKIIPAGTSYKYNVPGMFEGGVGIAVTPGSSMLVQYQITKDSLYRDWPLGTVTEYTEDVLMTSVHALLIWAYGADGIVEITQ